MKLKASQLQGLVVCLLSLSLADCAAAANKEAARQKNWSPEYAEAYAKGRTLDEVQEGIGRNITKIFGQFAKRRDVGTGRITVSFIVQPNGSASDVRAVSSTYANPELEAAVVSVVQKIKFGARDVPPFLVPSYPINYSTKQ